MTPSSRIALLAAALVSAGTVGAGPVAAQRVPTAGDWSVSAQLFEPDLGTIFGISRMMSDRLDLGIELDWREGDSHEDVITSVTVTGDAETWHFNVGPVLRWYGDRTRPVSPYLRAKSTVGWSGSKLEVGNSVQRDREEFIIQGSLAIGAEWYPIRQLAIGGHTGFQYLYTDYDSLENDGNTNRKGNTHTWGTFRSGLELRFFFR